MSAFHVSIDYCCTIAEMAKFLTALATDDPTEEPASSVDALLTTENRIADGIFNVDD